MRAGTRGMALISDPLNSRVLEALAGGPLDLPTLRRDVGTPAQTTLRTHLRELAELKLVDRSISQGFTRSASHELTQPGRELLAAARVFGWWLSSAPDGPVSLGSSEGKRNIQALAGAWNTAILRALAAKPLSLTELDQLIGGSNYPALERRLAAMRETKQIAATSLGMTPTWYGLTRWTRKAAAALLAAAGWEGRHGSGVVEPLARVDVEGIFLLAGPLLRSRNPIQGTCKLAMTVKDGPVPECAGVVLCLESGRAVSYRSDRHVDAHAWAEGSIAAWTGALGPGGKAELDIGGEWELASAVVAGLRLGVSPSPEVSCDGV